MNQMRLVQQTQGIQQLLCKHANKGGAQSAELVLLDELVEVDAKQFERKAQMLPVNECVLEAKQMVVVVLVVLTVELWDVSRCSTNEMRGKNKPDPKQKPPSCSD